MKILQLCNKVPFPEKDGGSLGTAVYTKALLNAGHQVKMLAMNTSRHFTNLDSIDKQLRQSLALESVKVNTSIRPISALIALLKGESYHVSRFISKAFAHKLSEVLKSETFDIIQLEGLYLTPYINTIRSHTLAPIILRESNVEWLIWERLAQEEKGLKRRYLNILTRQLKEYETRVINQCDGVITFTKEDMHKLKGMGCKKPINTIPFGLDITRYEPTLPKEPNTFFFIGALDWRPNLQGLDWFLENVWPKVNESYPDWKFHVAGRNMPEKYRLASYPNAVFHGEVESALKFMNTYNIMLVPVLAGSGVKVKIIEGMAMQKPIITTSIGLEGIECIQGTDALVANTPDEFFNAIKRYLDNSLLTTTIGANARIYCMMHHNIKQIVNGLVTLYQKKIGA